MFTCFPCFSFSLRSTRLRRNFSVEKQIILDISGIFPRLWRSVYIPDITHMTKCVLLSFPFLSRQGVFEYAVGSESWIGRVNEGGLPNSQAEMRRRRGIQSGGSDRKRDPLQPKDSSLLSGMFVVIKLQLFHMFTKRVFTTQGYFYYSRGEKNGRGFECLYHV